MLVCRLSRLRACVQGYAHKSREVVSRMAGCTANAVALTKREVLRLRAKAIFIASDVPWEGGNAATMALNPDASQNQEPDDAINSAMNSSASTGWQAPPPPTGFLKMPSWGWGKMQRSESWGMMVEKFGEDGSIGAAQESLRRLRAQLPGSIMLEELEPRVQSMDSGKGPVPLC